MRLAEFESAIAQSEILSQIPNKDFFSTLISPYPAASHKLFSKGYSALSSNFSHKSLLKNHFSCLTKGEQMCNTSSNWNIGLNLIPDIENLSYSSVSKITRTLDYIFQKLTINASTIMLGSKDIDVLSISKSDLKICYLKNN